MANSKVWMYESNTNDALAKQVYKDNSIVMTSPLMALDLIALIPLILGLEYCSREVFFTCPFLVAMII